MKKQHEQAVARPIRYEGHLYAAPKDRSSRFKIEIWEQETPHYTGSGSDMKWEQVSISNRKYYRTKDGQEVSKAGDHFIIPELDDIVVYTLTEDEVKKADLS